MLLFTAETPPITSPLITVIEQKEEVPAPVEYTLEEKIKLNVNNCNTDTQWIWAQDATCHDKSVVTARTTENKRETVKSGSYASSGYWPKGYCTTYVASRRPVGQWNDASLWRSQALADGWTVSANPVVGAIAWQSGHVAYVESVNDTTVTVSEMNYVGWNKVSSRTVPISTFSYIY